MANGCMVVNIGPATATGKLSRTAREKEDPGHCQHCSKFRNTLFSYDDEGRSYCNKSCWNTDKLIRAGIRKPTRQQIRLHNQRQRESKERSARRLTVLRLAG